jgi:hypothetical protein
MRAPRSALMLVLAVASVLGSGCIGVGTDGYWPPGTEVIVSTRASRVLADVPIAQRQKSKGARQVPIENGARVVCLDRFRDISSNPLQSGTNILALPIRVKPLTGAYTGMELVVKRGDLSLPPEPAQKTLGAFILILVACTCVAAAMAALEVCAEEVKSRLHWFRQWCAAHPGERLLARDRSHRMVRSHPQPDEEDQARWLAWIANRNTLCSSARRKGLRPPTIAQPK